MLSVFFCQLKEYAFLLTIASSVWSPFCLSEWDREEKKSHSLGYKYIIPVFSSAEQHHVVCISHYATYSLVRQGDSAGVKTSCDFTEGNNDT